MNIKRLVLGTAAGALAVTGVSSAQAADLPVVVDPVDYVRICDAYGAGYYFIPGTETCLRIAGRVRADYNIYFDSDDSFSIPSTVSPGFNTPFQTTVPGTNPNFVQGNGYTAAGNPFRLNGNRGFSQVNDQGYRFRARGYIYMESRTATEFGLLRTYNEIQFTRDNAGGTNVNLDSSVIQFGGLIFGRTDSLYDYDDVGGNWQTFGRFASDQKINLIGYQAAFGNGFSAAISLEDSATRQSGIAQFVTGNVAVLTGAGVVNIPGNSALFNRQAVEQIPDLVGNLRVDQGWGSAQVMGALHYVEAVGITFPFGGQLGDGHDDDIGFAIGAGVNVNVPFGASTSIGVQANYAKGAISYAMSSGLNSLIGYADGVITTNGSLELVDVFSVEANIAGSFGPNVVASLGGGYAYIDHAAVQTDPGGFAGLESLDSNNFGVTGYVGYRPVSGLEFGVGADFIYQDTDDFGESSALSTFFRAQRTF